MIDRYTRETMRALWSEEAKLNRWMEVELAVCRALARRNVIPEQSLKSIERNARLDPQRMAAIEEEVKHDVIAFLTAIGENLGPDARYLHLGMTSSDLVDTALACQLKQAGTFLLQDIDALQAALKTKAYEYQATPMIGRTHGMHAEPVTFGLKCALWFDEFSRQRCRLAAAVDEIAVGKISGAVGTYVHLPPDVEADVCEELGLRPATASTQVISRDRHAQFFSVLAGIASSIEKVALEIRNLQRSEIFEVAEPFGKGQKGSSAMPHKRNPILSENITGLARLVRSYAIAALEDVALWHERDISHSSVERVIAPDATTLVDFMLARLTHIIAHLEVFPDRMAANLEAGRGLYASQQILLMLTKKGMPREEAYRLVQRAAMQTWKEGKHFCDVIDSDPNVTNLLSADELDQAFDLTAYLVHVDTIFERIFRCSPKSTSR